MPWVQVLDLQVASPFPIAGQVAELNSTVGLNLPEYLPPLEANCLMRQGRRVDMLVAAHLPPQTDIPRLLLLVKRIPFSVA